MIILCDYLYAHSMGICAVFNVTISSSCWLIKSAYCNESYTINIWQIYSNIAWWHCGRAL